MKNILCIAVIAFFSMVASAATATLSNSEIDDLLSGVEALVDVAVKWTATLPEPSDRFEYSDSDAFDMQIRESMRAELRSITVVVDGRFQLDTRPPRVERWLSRIHDTDGTIHSCPKPEFLGWIVRSVVALVRGIDQFVTYLPARRYNAVLIYDKPDAAEIYGDVGSVESVIFRHRDKTDSPRCRGGSQITPSTL